MQLFHLTAENMAAQRNPDGVASFEKLVELSCVCQDAMIAFDNVDDMIIDHPHLLGVMGVERQELDEVLRFLRRICSAAHDARTDAATDLKRQVRDQAQAAQAPATAEQPHEETPEPREA